MSYEHPVDAPGAIATRPAPPLDLADVGLQIAGYPPRYSVDAADASPSVDEPGLDETDLDETDLDETDLDDRTPPNAIAATPPKRGGKHVGARIDCRT